MFCFGTYVLMLCFFEQHCLGKGMCDVPIERSLFDKGGDQCPDISKTLAIQASCGDGQKQG